MKQYHKHLQAILDQGTVKPPARKGMPGSISLFGYQNSYDLKDGFPILTTKKVSFRQIATELIWFLNGDTNIKYLIRNGCNIWNEDAYNYYKKLCEENDAPKLKYEAFLGKIKNWTETTLESYSFGDCGHQYGKLWREWNRHNAKPLHIDQIKNLIQGLIHSPASRRHIITAWNPSTLDQMALHACHCLVQFNARPLTQDERIDTLDPIDRETVLDSKMSQAEGLLDDLNAPRYALDCQLYQRSADMFLGVPYNISSYSLLTEIVAAVCNMVPGKFIHTFGDSHIYENHLDQVNEILSRNPNKYDLPKLSMNGNFIDASRAAEDIVTGDVTNKDFALVGYESYPAIKAKISTGLK